MALSCAMPQDNCLSLNPHAPLEKFCSTPDVEQEVASQQRIAFSRLVLGRLPFDFMQTRIHDFLKDPPCSRKCAQASPRCEVNSQWRADSSNFSA